LELGESHLPAKNRKRRMEIRYKSGWINAFSNQKVRTPRAPKKIIHKGKAYYAVGATALILSTTPKRVKEMMGSGDLKWTQLRVNGRLYISADSIVAYQKRRQHG
jgi:hypothetical protein